MRLSEISLSIDERVKVLGAVPATMPEVEDHLLRVPWDRDRLLEVEYQPEGEGYRLLVRAPGEPVAFERRPDGNVVPIRDPEAP